MCVLHEDTMSSSDQSSPSPDFESTDHGSDQESFSERRTGDGNESNEISEVSEELEDSSTSRSKKRARPLDRPSLTQEELRKRGVVYMSRIPPHMKVHHIRKLLSEWAPLQRIYCVVETKEEAQKRRKRIGGPKGPQLKEGWIEFTKKKDAVRTAEFLNGEKMSQKKNDRWAEDLWCLRYLKHFKWDHLTQEVRMKQRIAEKKLRNQIVEAKREANAILENRDRDIVSQKIKEKKERQKNKKELTPEADPDANSKPVKTRKATEYQQKRVVEEPKDETLNEGFFRGLLGDVPPEQTEEKNIEPVSPSNKKRKANQFEFRRGKKIKTR